MAETRSLGWIPIALAAVLTVSCSRPADSVIPDPVHRASDPWPLGAGCDSEPDSHCSNLVNRVMVPMFRGSNIEIRDESSSELCRRMALDLIGRAPTEEENAQCARETPAQMADRFMLSPEYVRQQRRAWGERFYNLDEQWYPYSVEVDDLVERLYRDYDRYDVFMTQLLVHPGFYATFRGDDWASNVIRYALGRNARADEISALRPLSRLFDGRRFCDGTLWWNARTRRNGTDTGADGSCGRDEFAANFCHCRDRDGQSKCRTDAFGGTIDFGVDGCVDPQRENEDLNSFRITEAGAGRPPVCPGMPYYNQCQDRGYGDGGPAGQLARLPGISDAQRDRLHSLGRVLSARPDFWEAAVDRELRRFLDWWQAGLRKPDFDIPMVRSTLADELRRTGSLRQIQRLIVTSLLYTQRGELQPGEAPPSPAWPVWATGPTRIMTAERWLDSVFYVTFGETAGVCDFRFVTDNYDWRMLINRQLAMQDPTENQFTDQYRDWVLSLSGCSSVQARNTHSTLSIVSSQHEIAQRLCAAGPQVLAPDTSDAATPEAYGAFATRIYRRALGRDPSDEERDAAVNDMTACNAEGGDNGCGSSGHAAMRWFCARLLDSAEFAVY